MTKECQHCGRKVLCPMSVPHSVAACRRVKWFAALGYLAGYGLILKSTHVATQANLSTELGIYLLLRTTLITILFTITLWACNHVIACAILGGGPVERKTP